MRVALVEDDADLLRLTSVVLRRAGHEVLTALDGVEGTELILSEEPDPDRRARRSRPRRHRGSPRRGAGGDLRGPAGRGTLVGTGVEELVPERFRDTHVAHREDYADEPRLRPMGAGRELSVLRADGSEVPVDIMLNPVETEEGLLVVAALRDVTERRQIEATREAFLRAVADLIHGVTDVIGTDDHPMAVQIEADAEVASIDPAQIERVVEDEGPGIPDEEKDAIFAPFQRGDAGHHSPGTGIGLSLVQRFAELHGGRAWVEDRPGGGARFNVLLGDG